MYKMKSISFLVSMALTYSLWGQQKSKEFSDEVIGSATLLHKPANELFDRWEIGFHDSNYKNQVLWFLAKSEKGENIISAFYRIKKKPFDKMKPGDLLGLVFKGEKEYPVINGRVNLDINAVQLIMKAKLNTRELGKKRYSYQGKYKIIEAR